MKLFEKTIKILFLFLFSQSIIYACSTCINNVEPTQSTNALSLSILSLLGFTSFVLGGILSFIFIIRSRIKKLKSKILNN
ncbi:MAG: hypothetical protein O3A55_01970 [Bacteroidetes bacterium]|nr:hypothetical protein [Bacteroidota bacterium]